jgi:hypothetical protein
MKNIVAITTILSLSLSAIACSGQPAPAPISKNLPQASIITNDAANSAENLTTISDKSATNRSLTNEEEAGLLFMREEEKLAHDLYLSFYDMWGLPIFQNIAGSEQTHMDSVTVLLERYGIPDPAAGNPSGVFSDPALQDLYNQLLAQGSLSISEALKVGAAVEEIDILDLREHSAQTLFADILQVYSALETGSRNHLRAFVSVLENQTGEVYTPGYLTPEDYLAIISSDDEGIGQGSGGSNGQGGPRNN